MPGAPLLAESKREREQRGKRKEMQERELDLVLPAQIGVLRGQPVIASMMLNASACAARE